MGTIALGGLLGGAYDERNAKHSEPKYVVIRPLGLQGYSQIVKIPDSLTIVLMSSSCISLCVRKKKGQKDKWRTQ